MSKSFHAVISALQSAGLDYRAIVYRIAQHHPKIVVDAINCLSCPQQSPLERECRELIASERTINAIKLYRERTGVGLKEAKEAIYRMREAVL